MKGIDAHQHFWIFDPVRDQWIDQRMKVIQRDFLPPDIHPLLTQEGIEGCVTVQSDQSEAENIFQLSHANQYEFVRGIVGWVDFQAEDIVDRLHHLNQFKKLKGFRHILQGEKQRDFMLRPEFKRGIAALHTFGYTYDILIYPDQLSFTRTFIASFPYQPFVIDHLAKPYIRERKIDAWKKDMMSLSQYEHVFCKVSGMVTEADWEHWTQEDFRPYLDVVVDAFGPRRLMFGSDWPVCNVAASYAEVVHLVKDYFASFSETEQNAFWGDNARNFYKL